MRHLRTASEQGAVAAISLIAMCWVTFDHEALGHGGACLALGGHILVLTSAIFRCDLHSRWIAPAGPVSNLMVGALALMLTHRIPQALANARLLFLLVASFSFFWEGAYLVDAMVSRNGDLYFAGLDFLGPPTLGWRIAGGIAGIALYLYTIRWCSAALSNLWPDFGACRGVARTAWVSASLGAGVAALAHSGDGWANVRDAVLEIDVASLPLFFMPRRRITLATDLRSVEIQSPAVTIALSIVVYLTFVATLGHGLHF